MHDLYAVEHFLSAVSHARGRRARFVACDIVFHLLYLALLTFVVVGVLFSVLFVLGEIFVVIAPVFLYLTVFDIDDYLAYVVEEYGIVRYEYERAFIAVQEFSQPFDML